LTGAHPPMVAAAAAPPVDPCCTFAAVTESLVPIFRVADGRAAADWYARLGFAVIGEHRFEPDLPLYLFLRRGDDVYLHLSEHTGDARPGTLVYLYVDDVDAVAAEFGVQVHAEPWAREVELTDPDGNRLRVGTRTASS
jgi:hypothetical protein